MTAERVSVPTRRRLAALAALVGTGALVGFVVGALFRHLGELFIGLLGLVLAVAGGWWVVTRRALHRAIGAVVLSSDWSCSPVAVVRAVGSTDRIALRLAIVLVLLGVTMACAPRRWSATSTALIKAVARRARHAGPSCCAIRGPATGRSSGSG